MSVLEVTGLTHTFGDKALYKDAEFTLFQGEHMGIVGQNGAGKSTLIKIMTGEVVPDKGLLKWHPGVRVGELNQYAQTDGHYTIRQFLQSAFQDLFDAQEKVEALYEKAAVDGDEQAMIEASELQELLEAKDFYSVESEIAKLENGLGITALGVDTPLEELSGGQRAKVILAKLLLEKADVLLLDEPTNFLDREHIAWLTDYLKAFKGAFAVVSHDYDFLENICTSICDVEFQTIKKYHGTFSDFLKQKGQLREDYIRQYQAQQKKIEQTEEFIRRNKAGIKSKMARGRQKQLDRMERLEAPAFTTKPHIDFKWTPLTSPTSLRVQDLQVGYSDAILPKLNFSVATGQKLVITGFNGIGKSTLIKTLMGLIPAIGGRYQFAPGISIGYYEQDLRWERANRTPMQVISAAYPNMKEKDIIKALFRCGVSNEHCKQEIGTLSGGEQSKVKLCRMLLTPVNFLILDEPTNHLDAETKDSLRDALIGFEGGMIVVSHEESFYRDWADDIFNIERCR